MSNTTTTTTMLIILVSLFFYSVKGSDVSKCVMKNSNHIDKKLWYLTVSFAQIDFYACNLQDHPSENINKASFIYKFYVVRVYNSIFKSNFQSTIDTKLENIGSLSITAEEKIRIKSLVDGFTYDIRMYDVLDLTMVKETKKLCLTYKTYYNLATPLYEKCVDLLPEKFDIIISYLKSIKIN
jgi:CRISPR/Cas system-associated endoribonuclease Cas2